MNEQDIRDIAEAAFRDCFKDVKLVQVDVGTRLNHDEAPVVDVKIIYDGDYEQLKGNGLMKVQREIVSKAWREVKEDLGFPIVDFVAKSDLVPHDPATA